MAGTDIEVVATEGTPYLLVDAAAMERNVSRMAGMAAENGVSLRPHIKTHKIPGIARRQVGAGAVGVTTATVGEAAVMADGGIQDIFIAFPLVSEGKIRHAVSLADNVRLILAVDSLEGAGRTSAIARDEGVNLEVRLEVDTGLRRTGIPYDDALDLARKIDALENLDLRGIYTYRGAVMTDGSPTLDLEAAGREEGEIMASLAGEMREDGIDVGDVSLGSTPTAEHAARVEGVTEVRPGTYVFCDTMQARLGACSPGDRALAVVATVVSRPRPDLAIIDGGSKTFATDVQPGKGPLNLVGFGEVDGHPGAVLERLTEEHGMMRVPENDDLAVGDVIRVFPNHVCSTVNLHDAVFVEEDDGTVRRVRVAARGKVR